MPPWTPWCPGFSPFSTDLRGRSSKQGACLLNSSPTVQYSCTVQYRGSAYCTVDDLGRMGGQTAARQQPPSDSMIRSCQSLSTESKTKRFPDFRNPISLLGEVLHTRVGEAHRKTRNATHTVTDRRGVRKRNTKCPRSSESLRLDRCRTNGARDRCQNYLSRGSFLSCG